MNAKENAWRLGAITRRLILLPAIVVAVSLAFTEAASAQPVFRASLKATGPTSPPCSAFVCGTASIDGYGPASFTWTLNSLTPTSNPACFSYSAVVLFALSDGISTLSLNEAGLVCGPGFSAVAQPPGSNENGHPGFATGSWSVGAATGQFSGLTDATGADTFRVAGNAFLGAYAGT
jgi:hypothetical protein